MCVLHNYFPFMMSCGVPVLFQSFPRELGEAQSKVAKVFVGGAVVIGVVLLIWGPLVVISVVNQANVPYSPTGASVRLTLDGFEVRSHTPLVCACVCVCVPTLRFSAPSFQQQCRKMSKRMTHRHTHTHDNYHMPREFPHQGIIIKTNSLS